MGLDNNGQRNGWIYNKKTLKQSIENNNYVKTVRKKLLDQKMRKRFQK